MTDWSRRFDDPIKTADGKTLRTLKDAAEYVLALPKKVQAEPVWQFAAEALRNAAERRDRVDVVCAASDDARTARTRRAADRQSRGQERNEVVDETKAGEGSLNDKNPTPKAPAKSGRNGPL